METQELVEKKVFSEVIKFSVTEVVIAELQKKYLNLKVKDVEDKEGFDLCHTGRMEVRDLRIKVDKQRKAYKESALDYNRRVEDEAKKVMKPLEDIEAHLVREEKKVTDEKKRIIEEAEKKGAIKLEMRLATLQRYKAEYSIEEVRALTDEGFEEFIEEAKTIHYEAEKKRIEAEEKLVKLEAEKLEQQKKIDAQEAENKRIRIEQEKKTQAERAEQQKKLDEKDAENKKIRDELEERLRKESAEKDRIIKVEREKRDAEDRKREREEEAKRIEQKKKDDEIATVKKAAEDRIVEEKAKQAEAKRIAEAKARQKVADEALFNSIKVKFHTIELAWVEIAQLTKKEREHGTKFPAS